jgi:hypothetical protein
MELDTNEPLNPQTENSPMPTRDNMVPIPMLHASEQLSESSKLDNILSMMHKGFENMGNIVNSKLEKALAPINSRLQQLEGMLCQPDDIYLNWGQGDVNIDSRLANYATLEQLDLLCIQRKSQEFKKQYAAYEEEEERHLKKEEAHTERWKNVDKRGKCKMIEVEGGDPDIVMTNHGDYTNPIYVPGSQESVFPPCPTLAPPIQGCQPIPSLEWKTVGHKQVNTLPTIRGNSYAAQAKQMMPNPPPKNTTPATPTTPAFTSEQLHTQSTTKAAIVQNAQDALNVCLSITKPKAKLIQAYKNVLAS